MTGRSNLKTEHAQETQVLESEELQELIKRALAEDIASGDITAAAVVPEGSISVAMLVLKEAAVIAGIKIFEMVLRALDANLAFEAKVKDSQELAQTPYCLARIEGSSRALLSSERTALNLMQRMCGIASLTSKFVKLAAPHKIEILDTRKTTPGLRLIEKLAVKYGGGTNHRFGLYDSILIKDNHIAIAGGIKSAVRNARKARGDEAIEVEVNTLAQLEEALALSVERVMLDNMSPEMVQKAVAIASGKTYIEVSGGINLANLEAYLIPGVNGISVGALTHSAGNIDISLEFES